MAQVMELLGEMPRSLALSGKYSHEMFNRRGQSEWFKKLQLADLRRGASAHFAVTRLAADFGPEGEIPDGAFRR